MSVGAKLLSSFAASGDVASYIRCGLTEELFLPSERILFDVIDAHVTKYGAFPSEDVVKKELNGEFDGYDSCEDAPGYYHDQLVERYLHRGLQAGITQAVESLNQQDPKASLDVLSDMVTDLLMRKDPDKLIDFRNSKDLITRQYQKVWNQDEEQGGLRFGWPYLDNMTQGLWPGDLVTYVGRPAMGKTFNLLYTALHGWAVQKKPILFVSMEMIPLLILQRLTAMHLKLPLTNLMHADLSKPLADKMKEGLSNLSKSEVPFWILDGNLSSSVKDVFRYARQLKPEAVFIDGAYLLEHENHRLNEYAKVSENAKRLKGQIAGSLGVPVIASYQFNREASKKMQKKSGDNVPGLQDIGYSDAIGQLSSIVLGLLEDESVETLKSRRINVLKGRYGEVGEFKIKWDFMHMDFCEIDETEGDLQFL